MKSIKRLKKCNKGEFSELFYKFYLSKYVNGYHPIFGIVNKLENIPGDQIKKNIIYSFSDKVTKILNIKKVGPRSKADIYINDIGYSFKSFIGANPSIINHTHRKSMIKVFDRLDLDISDMDEDIHKYIDLRSNSLISQDLKNDNSISPWFKRKPYFDKLLKYFIFEGTGAAYSKFQCQKLILFNNYSDLSDITVINKKYFDACLDILYPSLTISMRSKGLPKKKGDSIKKWCHDFDDKTKGTFHVRINTKIFNSNLKKILNDI